jgi:hypothetical protein
MVRVDLVVGVLADLAWVREWYHLRRGAAVEAIRNIQRPYVWWTRDWRRAGRRPAPTTNKVGAGDLKVASRPSTPGRKQRAYVFAEGFGVVVITITLTRTSAEPRIVRAPSDSPAKKYPIRTATTGFTYA